MRKTLRRIGLVSGLGGVALAGLLVAPTESNAQGVESTTVVVPEGLKITHPLLRPGRELKGQLRTGIEEQRRLGTDETCEFDSKLGLKPIADRVDSTGDKTTSCLTESDSELPYAIRQTAWWTFKIDDSEENDPVWDFVLVGLDSSSRVPRDRKIGSLNQKLEVKNSVSRFVGSMPSGDYLEACDKFDLNAGVGTGAQYSKTISGDLTSRISSTVGAEGNVGVIKLSGATTIGVEASAGIDVTKGQTVTQSSNTTESMARDCDVGQVQMFGSVFDHTLYPKSSPDEIFFPENTANGIPVRSFSRDIHSLVLVMIPQGEEFDFQVFTEGTSECDPIRYTDADGVASTLETCKQRTP